MYTQQRISSEEALKMIQHIIHEAHQIKKEIAVAVSGPEGEPLAFLRMDGASPAASRIARNKAYTAAIDRKDTKLMGEFMNDNDRPPAFWGDDGVTGFGGGVTVRSKGVVVGGIGVSGLSEAEDERIAYAAIAAVYGKDHKND